MQRLHTTSKLVNSSGSSSSGGGGSGSDSGSGSGSGSTLCLKKREHQTFRDNFVESKPIFEILSLADSARNS